VRKSVPERKSCNRCSNEKQETIYISQVVEEEKGKKMHYLINKWICTEINTIGGGK
jgi:hypothetical protein